MSLALSYISYLLAERNAQTLTIRHCDFYKEHFILLMCAVKYNCQGIPFLLFR